MAIIGVLNTLVTADASKFDATMKGVGDKTAGFRQKVGAEAKGISDALNAMGNLTGLGGGIASTISQITSTIGLIKTIAVGFVNFFISIAQQIVMPFVHAGVAIASVFISLGKTIVTTMISVLGIVVTAIAQATAATAANFVMLIGGLIANIPTAGIGLLIGAVVTLGAVVLAAAGGTVAFTAAMTAATGAVSLFGAVLSAPFALLATLIPALLPIMGGFAAALGSIGVGLVVFGGVVGGILAFSAAIVAATMKLNSMASAGASAIKEIRSMAIQLGATTEAMAALSIMGGSLDHSVMHMQRSMQELTGATHGARGAFQLLGIEPVTLQAMSLNDQLRAVAEAFRNVTDQGERAAIVRGLFGRGGGDMIGFLARGAAGIDAMEERARRFGLTFTRSQADAVNSATREWGGFSLAMDGISRQAAIMFAPFWEFIGRIGGQIGETLVGGFMEFANVARVATPDILRALTEIWGNIRAGINDAMAFIGGFAGQWGLSFRTITDFALVALAIIVRGLRNLDMVWDLVVTALQIGWLKFVQFIGPPLVTALGVIKGVWDTLPQAWDIVLDRLKAGWLLLLADIGREASITAMAIPLLAGAMIDAEVDADMSHRSAWRRATDAAANAANMMQIGQESIEAANTLIANANRETRMLPVSLRMNVRDATAEVQRQFDDLFPNLQGQIDGLSERLNLVWAGLGDGIRGLAEEWRNALNQINADALNAAVRPLQAGLLKAQAGHEAITNQSEKAFSMLFGTRGNQDKWAQETAAALAGRGGVRDLMQDLVGEMRQAPAIRRARI